MTTVLWYFFNSSLFYADLKGDLPVNNSNNMVPKDQTSAL